MTRPWGRQRRSLDSRQAPSGILTGVTRGRTRSSRTFGTSEERQSRSQRSPDPRIVPAALPAQPALTNVRFGPRRASSRRVPVLRTFRFHPLVRFQGNPTRRAPAPPIDRRRHSQLMKKKGSDEAAWPSFRRATSLVPSLPRPTRDDSRTRTWRRTIRASGTVSYVRSRC